MKLAEVWPSSRARAPVAPHCRARRAALAGGPPGTRPRDPTGTRIMTDGGWTAP